MNVSRPVDTATSAPPPISPLRAALALALLLGLQPITTDLYLPALPTLQRDLQAPMSAVQLTMSLLLLAFGCAQLLIGPLSDRYGRRPVLLLSLALYSVASLGASLAAGITGLIAMRALQGVGLAGSVVCARAMVRDLYPPTEGARVLSRGLSGLGLIAIAGPVLGGLLAASFGWRATMVAVTASGVLTWLYVWRSLPETAPALNPQATDWRPLGRTLALIAGHRGFRAWTALIASTYGGLFVLLAGSSFVYIGTLGLPPWGYGLAMATASLSYLLGTVACRRLLGVHGLAGTVRLGGYFTLAGGMGMLALGLGGAQLPAACLLAGVLLAHCLYTFGHGIHQPCGQASAVGAFPQAAGVASALSGFTLALTAFFVGLWLGQVLDGSLRAMAVVLAFWSGVTCTVAWTLVQRDGERFLSRPA